MKKFFIGPSHIVRFQDAFERHLLPKQDNVEFYGLPAAPCWNKLLIDQISQNHNKYDEIIFFVPDYRFGNKILSENPILFEDNKFYDGYYGVDKNLLNLKNDIKMAYKTITTLEYIAENFDNVFFLFYDLIFRDIWNKKFHIRNQMLSYERFSEYFSKKTIQIRNIQISKYDDYYNCLVDPSLHSSNIGFLTIFNLLFCQGSLVKDFDFAFESSITYMKKYIRNLLNINNLNNICLYGDSIFLKRISNIDNNFFIYSTEFNSQQIHDLLKSGKRVVILTKKIFLTVKSYVSYVSDTCSKFFFNSDILFFPFETIIINSCRAKNDYKENLMSDDEFKELLKQLSFINNDYINYIYIGNSLSVYPRFYDIFFSYLNKTFPID